MGAQLVKEAAIKTNDIVGDGTTTATVIAQAIVREGMKAIGDGGNPVLVKRGIDIAVGALVAHLRKVAHPMVSRADYARVAAISANNDDAVGAVLAEALHTVGDGGIVTVEESAAHGMSVEFVEGFEYDNGYLSPYLVTHPASLEAVARRPVHPAVQREDHQGPGADADPGQGDAAPRPLLVIAENVEGSALSMLVHNHVNGVFQACATRAPGFGDRRLRKLEDIATITGGEVYSRHAGFSLENMTLDQLGRARQVRVTADRTAIIDGAGSAGAGGVPGRRSCGPSWSGPPSASTRTCSPSGSARCPARWPSSGSAHRPTPSWPSCSTGWRTPCPPPVRRWPRGSSPAVAWPSCTRRRRSTTWS